MPFSAVIGAEWVNVALLMHFGVPFSILWECSRVSRGEKGLTSGAAASPAPIPPAVLALCVSVNDNHDEFIPVHALGKDPRSSGKISGSGLKSGLRL